MRYNKQDRLSPKFYNFKFISAEYKTRKVLHNAIISKQSGE